MGEVRGPEHAVLFAAVFSSDEELIAKAAVRLAEQYGEIGMDSGLFSFTEFTDYYTEEMGEGLKKKILVFASVIDPSSIAEIKLETNRIEKELSRGALRDVNIDPGYITEAKVVLATTKNYSHRIYLTDGIYCEITLTWFKGTFQTNPWTYRDYAQESVIGFFNSARGYVKSKSGNSAGT